MSGNLLIFGIGYSGRALAREMVARGWTVAGTTRSPGKAEALLEEGIEGLVFDGSPPGGALAEALARATHLVVSVAPAHGMGAGPSASATLDPVLEAAGPAIRSAMPALKWIGYWSTVGVYGDHGGSWVDEDAECRPVSRRARMRVEAEAAWLALGGEIGRPVAVMRLAGIYGPGRNALVKLADGTARRIVKPGQVFSRIHVEDIAGATAHLMERAAGGVFNFADDEPAPPQDVIAFAAGLMGVPAPPDISFDEAEMSAMARSFYGDNKRVSNARLKATGYALRHRDHRGALERMWREDGWR